jgi:hypothetical protein
MKHSAWPGLMKVLEAYHVRGGEVVWAARNLNNTFHRKGEELLLNYLFGGLAIPASLYLGLDGRTTIAEDDTMSSLVLEPVGAGYARQPVSTSGFTIELVGNVYRATSAIVSFEAQVAGIGWGPVSTLFLSDVSQGNGTLIATVPLGQSVSVAAGDTIMMRMGLSLRDYPVG